MERLQSRRHSRAVVLLGLLAILVAVALAWWAFRGGLRSLGPGPVQDPEERPPIIVSNGFSVVFELTEGEWAKVSTEPKWRYIHQGPSPNRFKVTLKEPDKDDQAEKQAQPKPDCPGYQPEGPTVTLRYKQGGFETARLLGIENGFATLDFRGSSGPEEASPRRLTVPGPKLWLSSVEVNGMKCEFPPATRWRVEIAHVSK